VAASLSGGARHLIHHALGHDLLVEQLQYNILFRWFVGLTMDDEVWHATTFTKNRRRFIEGNVACEFFSRVVTLARVKKLMSDDHFTVDGTMIEAAASHKSLVPRESGEAPTPPSTPSGRNPSVDFRGEKRSNETHVSRTDPDARLYCKMKGTAAKLAFLGHLLTENRNGLIVDARLTQATGTGERAAAVAMTAALNRRGVTIGADKGYDVGSFVEMLALFGAIPHVAQNVTRRRSAISDATATTDGYACSQRKRKLVEECFGWMKTYGLLRKLRHRGLPRVGWIFSFTAAAYNLIRIRNLASACA